jgi:hypothetical protein
MSIASILFVSISIGGFGKANTWEASYEQKARG